MGASQSIPEAGPVPGMEWCGSSELKPGAILREEREPSRYLRFDGHATPGVRSAATCNQLRQPTVTCCAPLDLKAGTAAMKQLFLSGSADAHLQQMRKMKASAVTKAPSAAAAKPSNAAKAPSAAAAKPSSVAKAPSAAAAKPSSAAKAPAASSSAKTSARGAPASARTPQKVPTARPTPAEEPSTPEKLVRPPVEGSLTERGPSQPLTLRPMIAQRPRHSTSSTTSTPLKGRGAAPAPASGAVGGALFLGAEVDAAAPSASSSSVPRLRVPPLRFATPSKVSSRGSKSALQVESIATSPSPPPPFTTAAVPAQSVASSAPAIGAGVKHPVPVAPVTTTKVVFAAPLSARGPFAASAPAGKATAAKEARPARHSTRSSTERGGAAAAAPAAAPAAATPAAAQAAVAPAAVAPTDFASAAVAPEVAQAVVAPAAVAPAALAPPAAVAPAAVQPAVAHGAMSPATLAPAAVVAPAVAQAAVAPVAVAPAALAPPAAVAPAAVQPAVAPAAVSVATLAPPAALAPSVAQAAVAPAAVAPAALAPPATLAPAAVRPAVAPAAVAPAALAPPAAVAPAAVQAAVALAAVAPAALAPAAVVAPVAAVAPVAVAQVVSAQPAAAPQRSAPPAPAAFTPMPAPGPAPSQAAVSSRDSQAAQTPSNPVVQQPATEVPRSTSVSEKECGAVQSESDGARSSDRTGDAELMQNRSRNSLSSVPSQFSACAVAPSVPGSLPERPLGEAAPSQFSACPVAPSVPCSLSERPQEPASPRSPASPTRAHFEPAVPTVRKAQGDGEEVEAETFAEFTTRAELVLSTSGVNIKSHDQLLETFRATEDISLAFAAFALMRRHVQERDRKQQQQQQQNHKTAHDPQYPYEGFRAYLPASWKANKLWNVLDDRRKRPEYKEMPCKGRHVVILGAGPCGLRAAIELRMLGAKVTVVDQRKRFSRINQLHLWAWCGEDLKGLGARILEPPPSSFGTNADLLHIGISDLQKLLLKAALLLGAKVYLGTDFVDSEWHERDGAWQARLGPSAAVLFESGDREGAAASLTDFAGELPSPAPPSTIRRVSAIVIAAGFGSELGRRHGLQVVETESLRRESAIGLICNFKRTNGLAERKLRSFSMAKQFYLNLFAEVAEATGAELENVVYTKGQESHYFVMTPTHRCLVEAGVIIDKTAKPMLARGNVDQAKLDAFIRKICAFEFKAGESSVLAAAAADLGKDAEELEYADNGPRLFDFSRMRRHDKGLTFIRRPDAPDDDSSNSDDEDEYSRVAHAAARAAKPTKELLVTVVGDALIEPFWPEGLGIVRGFFSVLDASAAIAAWSKGASQSQTRLQFERAFSQLKTLAAATRARVLRENEEKYALDPASRYRQIDVKAS